jgi:hypothetical protein
MEEQLKKPNKMLENAKNIQSSYNLFSSLLIKKGSYIHYNHRRRLVKYNYNALSS